MTTKPHHYSLLLLVPLLASCDAPKLPGVSAAVRSAVGAREASGAVTVVATKDKIVHCEATGLANTTNQEPMRPDSLFWIASMTKPVTAVALLMLQDEGKLNVTDPVAKYIPGFAGLKTPSGQPANLTIAQIMTHTSGLGEAPREAAANARTLADLIPLYLATPMQFEPGAKWSYCQSGINTTGWPIPPGLSRPDERCPETHAAHRRQRDPKHCLNALRQWRAVGRHAGERGDHAPLHGAARHREGNAYGNATASLVPERRSVADGRIETPAVPDAG
jgi:hypothetical protein